MNHSIRNISRDTARIAFELNDFIHPTKTLQILRIERNVDTPASRMEGIIVGENRNEPRAVIVNACRGDIIAIFHPISRGGSKPLFCFRITKNFEPIIENSFGLRGIGAIPRLDRIDVDHGGDCYFNDSNLKLLFRSRHPEWLQRILVEQLECWRDHSAPTFLKVASYQDLMRNIDQLVTHDPYRALRDYKDQLTSKQLMSCIRRQPKAAMRLAFDRIPLELRREHLKSHETFLLENHLYQLTNAELRDCSWADPVTAIRSRHLVSPRQHAIILSCSYTVAWCKIDGAFREPFAKEIFDSLARFPKEWLKGNPNGFVAIFNKLQSLLGIQFKSHELAALLDQMPPAGRKHLTAYLASRI